jgi:O-methyltransferase
MFYKMMSADDLETFEHALESMLRIFGRDNTFAADHLITFDRSLGFANDPNFLQAFQESCRTVQEKSIIWRLHVLCWAAKHALNIEGDFVECGVYEGLSSLMVAKYLKLESTDKTLWLYDLFDHSAVSSGMKMPAHGPNLLRRVKERFGPYPNARIIPGMVPDSFEQGAPKAISWFHLDLNSAEAETAALHHLFDRLTPGGLLIFDDYGWKTYPGQKAAADRFANERNHFILEIPTGQGLLIKH